MAIVHKIVGMEIWRRPRAAYPGSPRLDGLIFFKLHKLVSTLLGDDATLCTSYLFFYSRKAAACFLDFAAIVKSIATNVHKFVAIENVDTYGHFVDLWQLNLWTLVAIDFTIATNLWQ